MLAANSSLKILKPSNLGSNNIIRCFGSDAGNIIRVESKINLLNSKGMENAKIVVEHPTQSSLIKQNIPGFSDISTAQHGYKARILDNLVRQQVVYEMTNWPQQRKIVVNYIILLHKKINLNLQSLYLCISLINRSLPIMLKIGCVNLELLAITCLWMGAKIQQTRVPGVRHWAKFGRAFQQWQLIETEQQILTLLQYKTIAPTSLSFLYLFQNFLDTPLRSKQSYLSQYILQLTLFYPNLLTYSDSLLALSSIYLSFKILSLQWKQDFSDLIQVQISKIRKCASQLSICLQKDNKQKTSVVYRKYLSRKYKCVSHIQLGRKSMQKTKLIL